MRLKDFVADRAFYRKLLILILPLVLQQSISNIVNLLDNVMVGQLSIESFSAVSIVNQLLFVFNLSLFGAMAGGSIYGAQYHGQGNVDGVRYSMRVRLWLAMGLSFFAIIMFALAGTPMINAFLHQDAASSGDLELALSEAQDYLRISLWGLIPFAFSTVLSSALRDTGETFTPMVASILAILANALMNLLLIFGYLGFPEMGVRGAALATVLSRFLECGYLLIRSQKQKHRHPFLVGAFSSLKVPGNVARRILITGAPLMINELLWSTCITLISQCYSLRGLDAVAAINICNSAQQIFTIIMAAMGSAIAILVGQQLGAGNREGAWRTAWQLMALDLAIHLVIGGLMACCCKLVPQMYELEPHVQELTSQLFLILAFMIPPECLLQGCYFIMRAGGKAMTTFLFDCGFAMGVSLVLAYILVHFTSLPIVWVYGIVQAANLLKLVAGLLIVKSGTWLNNLTARTN